MTSIFISYSRKDEAAVQQLVRILERMKHTVRYDKDHAGGHIWWDAILDDIRSSKIVILALSTPYLDSLPCALEYHYAEANQRLILPVMVSPVDFGRLPASISKVNIVTFTDPMNRDQLLDLSAALTELSGQPIPALPDPLPPAPPAPIPRVSILLDTITGQQDELTPADQASITDELVDLFLQPGSRENARFALEKLRARHELRGQYITRIDNLLAMSSGQLKVERNKKADPPSRRGRNWNGFAAVRIAVAVIAIVVSLLALMSNSATANAQATQSAMTISAATAFPVPTMADPLATPTLIRVGAAVTPTIYATKMVKGVSFVWVPAGCFLMGSNPSVDTNAQPNEMPQHRVCLTQGYWIGQFDITNTQYDAFVQAGGYTNDAYWSPDSLAWKQQNKITGPYTDSNCTQASSSPDQPRVCVTYYEAEAYAKWLGARLPTEAEWEYAARGPNSLVYPWGNTFDSTETNTWENGLHNTTVIGTYQNGASWVGAQDMAGNVWQWVADWYGPYSSGSKSDPLEPGNGPERVVRGGSWYSSQTFVRASYRNGFYPDYHNYYLGFRVFLFLGVPLLDH